ncbi:MAG: CesT family type III secretion system chaperone [Methylocystis sp.]|uniref:CesT family type III secretion system chaperone n=1 Tax=Methylocystis sp. TaxID=1911079 RepID=UPI003DA5D1AC
MSETIESIGAKLKNVGQLIGADLALDSHGVAAMTYDDGRSCVFAAGGFPPRIGMAAPLVSGANKEQISHALALNATLERVAGVLALDDFGAIILTAARDAEGLTEEALASFMSDFIRQAAGFAALLHGVGASSGKASAAFPAPGGAEGLIRA